MAQKNEHEQAGRGPKSLDSALKESLTHELADRMGKKPAPTAAAPAAEEEPQRRGSLLSSVLHPVRRGEMLAFYEELALLLEYGAPLVEALGTLARRVENPVLGEVIADVRRRVERGESFSQACAQHPRRFSPLVISMLRAGERSGNLVRTLHNVAEQGERLEVLRHRALTAMIYPVIVIVFAVFVVAFAASFFVTTFKELIEQFGGRVPWPMQVLMHLGELFRSPAFWIALVAAVVGIVVAYRVAVQFEAMRLLRDRFLVRCPWIGGMVRESLAANFSRVFAAMLKAGVPLDEALAATYDTTKNALLRLTIERVRQSVREGGRVTPEFARADVFPPVVTDLASIGEETGELGSVFDRIGTIYEEKLASDTALVSKLATPAIVILLGLVVGFIMVAVFGTYVGVIEQLEVTKAF